jgi:hypothetical protein
MLALTRLVAQPFLAVLLGSSCRCRPRLLRRPANTNAWHNLVAPGAPGAVFAPGFSNVFLPLLYADCDLCNIRLLNNANSATNPSASCPANVAASIFVLNKIDVATSALHSRQYFSALPGSSTNSVLRPHTLHCIIDCCSLPFGPHNIAVSSPGSHPARIPAHSNTLRVGNHSSKNPQLSIRNS